MEKTELGTEPMEKVSGGYSLLGGDNITFMKKCKYELKWTRQQYLKWCTTQGTTDAELAVASMRWDTI